jgi:hypothetical protein
VESRGEMVSNIPDGPTLAPAGAAALLVTLLRSTAGSCFGLFIGLLLSLVRGGSKWTVRDHFQRNASRKRAIPRLQLNAGCWERCIEA